MHSTAVVNVYPSQFAGKPSVGDIASQAVINWCNEDDDSGSSNAGYGKLTAVMAGEAIDGYISVHTDDAIDDTLVIPVADAQDVKHSTKKARLAVSSELINKLQTNGYVYELLELAIKTFGSTVVNVSVVKLPKTAKAVATATTGKTVTKYKIVEPRRNLNNINYKTVLQGFVSQSIARAEAIRIVNSEDPNEKLYTDLEVHAYLTREDNNAALVTISRPKPVDSEIEILLTLAEPKPNAKIDKWVVAFDYHH